MTITKATPDQAGCWVDGHHGIYAYGFIVDLAVEHGWEIDEQDAIARKLAYDPKCDDAKRNLYLDYLIDGIADNAEQWMNEHVAPEGYRFGWHDGEWFFQSDEWWEEEG